MNDFEVSVAHGTSSKLKPRVKCLCDNRCCVTRYLMCSLHYWTRRGDDKLSVDYIILVVTTCNKQPIIS